MLDVSSPAKSTTSNFQAIAMPTHPKITPEERARRQEHADGARANVGLEGFKPDAETEEHMRRYIEGEITLAELVDPANDHFAMRR